VHEASKIRETARFFCYILSLLLWEQLHPRCVGNLTGPFTSATLTCSGDFVVFGASKIRETARFIFLQFYLYNTMDSWVRIGKNL
jgi:hypothetical protein